MKQTAEERQQIEAFLQKVIQKEIPVIEAAQTILRNRHKYASNELASYKAELRGKVERLFNNHAQKVGKREYVGLTKKQFLALLEDNPTEK